MGIQVVFGANAIIKTSSNSSVTSTISIAARRLAANGKGPQIITHGMLYLSGTTAQQTCRLTFAGYRTATVTLPKNATPQTTGFINLASQYLIANGDSTVAAGYAASSGNISRYTNSSGLISGAYEYIQSPTEPTGLSGDYTSTTGTFDLYWNAPVDDGGSPVTSYNVYQVSGTTYTLLGTTTGTSFQVSSITPVEGTTYNFVVRARNLVTDAASTQSIGSNTLAIFYTTKKVAAAPKVSNRPGTPTVITHDSTLAGVKIYWTASTLSGITKYNVYMNGTTASYLAYTLNSATVPTSGSPLTLSPANVTNTLINMRQLTSYSFTVQAASSTATSDMSLATTGTTSGVPTAPLNVKAEASKILSGTVNVSWQPPANTGGGITKYALYKVTSGTPSIVSSDISASTLTYAVGSLTPGVEYGFYVRARNAIGDVQSPTAVYGTQSGTAYAVAPGSPAAPLVTPSSTATGRLKIEWGTTASTSFSIIDANTLQVVTSGISPSATFFYIDGLSSSVEYSYYVQPDGADVSLLTASTPVAPYSTSVQDLATAEEVTNTSLDALNGTFTVLNTTGESLSYSKSGAPDLQVASLISPSALITDNTNVALSGSRVITDTTVVSPHTVSYAVTASDTAPAPVSDAVMLNNTNTLLNTTGATVTAVSDSLHIAFQKSLLSAATSSLARTGTSATITTTATHSFIKGQTIVVSGTTLESGALNGTWTITGVTSNTISFTTGSSGSISGSDTGGKIELAIDTVSTGSTDAFDSSLKNTLTNLSKRTFNVTSTPITSVTATSISYARPDHYSTNVSWSGTSATITTSANHGYVVGDIVSVSGFTSTPSALNGDQTITAKTDNTFTFTTTSGSYSSANTSGVIRYADADVVAATGTVDNVTNRDVFNSYVQYATAKTIDDYRTFTYSVDAELNDGLSIGGVTATVSNVARSGATATITTSAAHNILAGESITVSGLSSKLLNGTWTVASVPSSTTLTYTTSTSGTIASASDSGTVTTNSRAVPYPIGEARRVFSDTATSMDVDYRSGWLG